MKTKLKTYKIPVSWTMTGEIKIKATSLSEAVTSLDLTTAPGLPIGYYLDESFQIDTDCLQELYPEELL